MPVVPGQQQHVLANMDDGPTQHDILNHAYSGINLSKKKVKSSGPFLESQLNSFND